MVRVQVFGILGIGAAPKARQAEGVVAGFGGNAAVRARREDGGSQVVGVVVECLSARSGGRTEYGGEGRFDPGGS